MLLADGTSARYRGLISGVRCGSRVLTVDRVAIDNYVAGVVPREMPASWPAAAVSAQAVAVRTYARYEMSTSQPGDAYDICDSSSCQVYGGMARFSSSWQRLWVEDQAAVADNRRTYLAYGDAPAFTQFSASDGGSTLAGGQPYLPTQTDPYDSAAAGDPYLAQSATVSARSVAAYYGLRKVTGIKVTTRTGSGPWNGRVVAASVAGVSTRGASVSISTTGSALGGALGIWTDYFALSP